MRNATVTFFDDFLGGVIVPAAASNVAGPWAKGVTASAGTPTLEAVASEATGGLKMLLAGNSEAEILQLYWGDILSLRWDNLRSIAFRLKSSGITTNETLTFGLGSAKADATDDVTYNAWFKLAATTDILVETDDDSTNDDDNDTTLNITAHTHKEYVIDFSNGLADVRFFVSNGFGLDRVLDGTVFSLAGAAGTFCQPIVQLQKASGTTTPYCTIDWIEIEYIRS